MSGNVVMSLDQHLVMAWQLEITGVQSQVLGLGLNNSSGICEHEDIIGLHQLSNF